MATNIKSIWNSIIKFFKIIIPFILFILIGIVCIWFITTFVHKAEQQPLNQIELVYFTIITTLLTIIVSAGITHYYSKILTTQQMKLLGQSAIRHIKQMMISSKILSATIEKKIEKLEERKKKEANIDINLALEYFDNTLNQVTALQIGINTAKSDWTNILTEEIRESIESDEQIWGYFKEMNILKQEINEKNKQIVDMEQRAQEETKEYRDLIKEKENKIKSLEETEQKLRTKIIEINTAPNSWPTSWSSISSSTISSSSALSSPLESAFYNSGWRLCELCKKETPIGKCAKCGKWVCSACSDSVDISETDLLPNVNILCNICAKNK